MVMTSELLVLPKPISLHLQRPRRSPSSENREGQYHRGVPAEEMPGLWLQGKTEAPMERRCVSRHPRHGTPRQSGLCDEGRVQ